jgi:EmrB/QacA subfamily drug resistance transporter
MLVGFVWYSFRPAHPLLDLRLFKNRNLTVSTITLFVFAASFFGGLLLLPTYYQQVRGETTLDAGLLMIPQGLGAMVTMPIAGTLADRIPVGRIVPFGLVAIIGGMFSLTQLTATTSYWGYTIPALFVMGLGMGATMMPMMTAALKTLSSAQASRGSTLVNITQQIGSSIGVAVMSVILTNQIKSHPIVTQAQGFAEAAKQARDPAATGQLLQRYPEVAKVIAPHSQNPAAAQKGLLNAVHEALAAAFAHTYWVAAGLVLLTLVPVFFLPRRHQPHPQHQTDDQISQAPAVLVH